MSKIWDLSQYVEANPEDYEQRWRLAKKLYMASEYRLALEHLQVLRNNWIRKVNVRRYLAATYYRLERHDEAVNELRSAVEEWPDEVALREQLARVLEVAERNDEAIDAWKGVLARAPDHHVAARALAKLLMEREATAKQSPLEAQPIPADDAQLGVTCPRCGARNSEEFDRCWKCHAPFLAVGSVTSDVDSLVEEKAGLRIDPRAVNFLIGVALVALLLFGAYRTLQPMLLGSGEEEGERVIRTVHELLAGDLMRTRLIMALVLLVVGPASLWAALLFTGAQDISGFRVLGVGWILAALAYALSWLAIHQVWYAAVVPAVIALPLTAMCLWAGVVRVGLAWVIHGAVMLAVIAGTAAVLMGFGFVGEYPAISEFARNHDLASEPGRYPRGRVTTPSSLPVHWESTGSSWLDAKVGNRIGIALQVGAPSPGLTFELSDKESGTLAYEEVGGTAYDLVQDVILGRRYKIDLTGAEGAKVDVVFSGILEPRFGDQ